MHKFFYSFEANSHWEMGLKMGQEFADEVERGFSRLNSENVTISKHKMNQSLWFTKKYFPQYIEELEGYAKGANVKFEKLWYLSMDLDLFSEKCTTLITNHCKKFMHLEEGNLTSQAEICLVKTTLDKKVKFELYYYNTLGANACGLTSDGLIFSINNMYHNDKSFGIPKNVLARALVDCETLKKMTNILSKIPRMSGYNFNFIFTNLQNFQDLVGSNIETSAREYEIIDIETPYIHTNHYLGRLKYLDDLAVVQRKTATTSHNRYGFAKERIREEMSTQKLKELSSELLGNTGCDLHSYNSDGRMIFDLENKQIHVHLEREKATGWVVYNICDILNLNE